jgi:CTP:molybdopterin cytidylyltransferase MocA
MYPGIVLAAGRSSRFGRPKALAAAGDKTFITQILQALAAAGVGETVVVARPGDEGLEDEVDRAGPAVRIVVNPDPERGQLSSLLTGVDAIDRSDIDGAIVLLVDMPLVSASAIRRVIDASRSSPAAIVRAVHSGRHGHPVVFKRETFDALRAADPSVGAKAVVHAMRVEDVEVGEPGVIEDVDTPEDYRRLFERGEA